MLVFCHIWIESILGPLDLIKFMVLQAWHPEINLNKLKWNPDCYLAIKNWS